ncbi:MAG: Crp/Fnr family transcriptional regulator [Flavobacteriales bacterium]|nr:Crp/Fnr family transcriptional regulator [Flavobacteriales bacterium]
MDPAPNGHLVHLDQLIARYCSPEWQELLRAQNVRMELGKGEAIFTSGQQADRMYMVHRGRVKVVVHHPGSRERIIRLAGDGEVLGHRGIGDEPMYTASAIALGPTTVNTIPMGLFLSTLRANNLFCYHFLLFFAEEMRVLDQQMRDLMEMDVAQRIARVLLLCRSTFGMDPERPTVLAFTLPRRDIASMADTTYESVIRTLSDMQQKGTIELLGKEVRIRRRKELERMITG